MNSTLKFNFKQLLCTIFDAKCLDVQMTESIDASLVGLFVKSLFSFCLFLCISECVRKSIIMLIILKLPHELYGAVIMIISIETIIK